jgi:putative endonuclease
MHTRLHILIGAQMSNRAVVSEAITTKAVAPDAAKTKRTRAAHTRPADTRGAKGAEGAGKASSKKGAASKKGATRASGKNQKIGYLGENMACEYLERGDIVILERNWRCSFGEADIIADDQGTLVFIEVKTRSAGYPGLPESAVTKEKRGRYERIAVSYLERHERSSGRVRFDVIAIQLLGEHQCLLRHHLDAFSVDA